MARHDNSLLVLFICLDWFAWCVSFEHRILFFYDLCFEIETESNIVQASYGSKSSKCSRAVVWVGMLDAVTWLAVITAATREIDESVGLIRPHLTRWPYVLCTLGTEYFAFGTQTKRINQSTRTKNCWRLALWFAL